MPRKSKSAPKAIGIALITAGVCLGLWGHQKSGGFESKLSNVLTGAHSDNVMLLYIGGAVCLVVGIFYLIKK